LPYKSPIHDEGFGVKLECYYKEGDEGCEYSINKESYPFNHCDISHVEMVEDLIDMGVDRKIYVDRLSISNVDNFQNITLADCAGRLLILLYEKGINNFNK